MRSTSTIAALSLASLASAAHHQGLRRMHKPHRVRTTAEGIAYYGYQNDTMNACGTVSLDTDFIAGMSATYITSDSTDNCWKHLTVTLPDSTSVDVVATDNCEACSDSDLYLSIAAFEALSGSLDAGILNITWSWASDSSSSSAVVAATTDTVATSAVASVVAAPVETSSSDAVSSSSFAASFTSTTAQTSSTHATSSSVSSKSSSSSAAASSSTSTSSEGWSLHKSLTGQTLIDYFTATTGASDNSGVADYVDSLISTNDDGQVVMWVDTTATTDLRKSMKITSTETFNSGTLLIFDIVHMPIGCGTWPAIWMLGSGTWPAGGEIDIVEGVNNYEHNVMSIHTSEGCYLEASDVAQLVDSTLNVADDLSCYAYADGDQTCAATSTQSTSYGNGFNAAGGVYAARIVEEGIYIYTWPAGSVPSDITSGGPNPSTWSTQTFFSSSSCAVDTYFKDLSVIINTNLGGSFAEGVWASSGAGGQSTSCASSTGYSTAASYVQNVGSAFSDAYWQFDSIKIYQTS